MPQFIVTCPPGFEYPLVDEALSLGATSAKEGLMQILVEMEWRDVYRFCLWSRLANRVLYPIKQFTAESDDELYRAVSDVEWDIHLSFDSTFAVDFVSRRSTLDHEQYGALKVKDAIADYFKREFGERPNIDADCPNVQIHCRINKNEAELCIDLSGKGLHQRGYREQSGVAPLRENFAALMLIRSGWDKPERFTSLLDPMCGSGTLAIEAAQIAYKIAPGIHRTYWGFIGWKPFHTELYQAAYEEAKHHFEVAKNLTAAKQIFANDINASVLNVAKQNAHRAGVEHLIEFSNLDFSELFLASQNQKTLIVSNPPYGERLSDQESSERVYKRLGSWLKTNFEGHHATLLAATKAQGHAVGIRAEKVYRLKNGPIDVELIRIVIDKNNYVTPREEWTFDNYDNNLNVAAQGLLNRLKKNLASLKGFLNQHKVSCYRLYDSDLPDYNVAIDVYEDAIHIQEYAPPKDIDQGKAKRRLKDIERVVGGLLRVPAQRIAIKTRMRQKGRSQYQAKSQGNQESLEFVVHESDVRYWVNLSDYLDTGLFIDHRKARQMLADWSQPKLRLLNLFCYTATASVPVALRGAVTTNVDLSNTYLNWAKKNFELNSIALENHQFIRANCLDYLNKTENVYDIIFVDPPTFSNSKRLENDFDIQTAHVDLLRLCVKHLAPNGKLLFSNNFRKFNMQFISNDDVKVVECTRKTTSRDFMRKPLHRSWLIEKK